MISSSSPRNSSPSFSEKKHDTFGTLLSTIKEPNQLNYPFKSIIKTRGIQTPSHIKERSQQLKNMKEKINYIIKQADQLSKRKRDFSNESRQFDKFSGISERQQKNTAFIHGNMKVSQRFRNLASRSVQPKNYIGFSTYPTQQVKKGSIQMEFTGKKQELPPQHNQNSLQKYDKKSRMGKTLKSLNNFDFKHIEQGDINRRSSMLEREAELTSLNDPHSDLSETKVRELQQITSNSPTRPLKYSQQSEHLQLIYLQHQNKELKQEIKHLNNSREYYQKELIAQAKKYDEKDQEHQRSIKELRHQYVQVANQYQNRLEQKQKCINEMVGTVGLSASVKRFEYLQKKISDIVKENKSYLLENARKDKEISTLSIMLERQLEKGKQLLSELKISKIQLQVLRQFQKNALQNQTSSLAEAYQDEIKLLKLQLASEKELTLSLAKQIDQIRQKYIEMKTQSIERIAQEKMSKKQNEKQFTLQIERKQKTILLLEQRIDEIEKNDKHFLIYSDNHEKIDSVQEQGNKNKVMQHFQLSIQEQQERIIVS